jgi:hypothetical protein
MTVSSRNSNNPPGFTRKPAADLYTVLLIFALVALLVGILYLHLEMKAYNYKAATGMTVFPYATPVAVHCSPVAAEKGFKDHLLPLKLPSQSATTASLV